MLRRRRNWLEPLLALAFGMCVTLAARAQSTIKQPGQRPHYYFEAEPHLLAGLFDPPGFGDDTGLGVGFRGSIDMQRTSTKAGESKSESKPAAAASAAQTSGAAAGASR